MSAYAAFSGLPGRPPLRDLESHLQSQINLSPFSSFLPPGQNCHRRRDHHPVHPRMEDLLRFRDALAQGLTWRHIPQRHP